jgi:hypothetical protein
MASTSDIELVNLSTQKNIIIAQTKKQCNVNKQSNKRVVLIVNNKTTQ